MTGTKVVKLNLEGGGLADQLPKLAGFNDAIIADAHKVFDQTPHYASPSAYFRALVEDTGGLDVPSSQMQRVLDKSLEKYRHTGEYLGRAGFLISALIQNSSDKRFRLTVKEPLHVLGYGLGRGKELVVDGNLGDFTGSYLDGGRVIVNGSVASMAGDCMSAGELIVNGDVGERAGLSMKGGKIGVKGNASDELGGWMEGGIITVDGNVGTDAGKWMKGGEVHVNGDVGDNTGTGMNGGTLKVVGNSGDGTGWSMNGGIILIGGNVGKGTAGCARGGTIKVNGKIKEISKLLSERGEFKGEIWEEGFQIWPKK
ncbi:MAG: hypothetical protein V1921_06455 [Candidatus Altiarchaeota archaeon]